MTNLPELVIIKYILIYNNYIQYNKYIDISKELKEIRLIHHALSDLQSSVPNTDKTLEELESYTYASYPNLKAPQREALGLIFKTIREAQFSDDVVGEIIDKIKQKSLSAKIALAAVEYAESGSSWEDFKRMCQSVVEDKPSVPSEIIFVTDNLAELKEHTVSKRGLRWRLNCLNQSLGSLRGGDFGFIFARPERGKTTLLASETTYMAMQAEKPVIWFNNEEQGEKVKVRSFQGALGITSQELFSDIERYQREYNEITKGNHKIVDEAALHRRDVERVLSSIAPGLVIFDQIDKIKGFDADRPDIVYGRIYQWARELAKSFACPVIGICQADGTGEGVKWLTMSHVAEAKCLSPETKILMYDGTWKQVQDIRVGERVMGPDSCPRNVLATTTGQEEMFRVTHNIGGDSYVVNKSHLLSVKDQRGNLVARPVTEYLKSDFGYRVSYHTAKIAVPIRPYFLGVWLGDGGADKAEITTIDPEIVNAVKEECSLRNLEYAQYIEKERIIHARMKYKQGVTHPFLNVLKAWGLYKNKHIPDVYFQGSIAQRLDLIAGLLDTDGTLVRRKHEYYMFSNKNKQIAAGLKTLALSCGLMSTLKVREIKGTSYYFVTISGDLGQIPIRISRKQSTYKSKKDVLKSRLSISSEGLGKYAGIAVDGDHLFIIDGCIVTHNTSKQAEADWILGVGQSAQDGQEMIRFLNISKNKLFGDDDSDPQLRHGRFDVLIRPEIARYEDF